MSTSLSCSNSPLQQLYSMRAACIGASARACNLDFTSRYSSGPVASGPQSNHSSCSHMSDKLLMSDTAASFLNELSVQFITMAIPSGFLHWNTLVTVTGPCLVSVLIEEL